MSVLFLVDFVKLFPGVNWNFYWYAVIFAMVETWSEDVSGLV